MVRVIKKRPFFSFGLAALLMVLLSLPLWVNQVFAEHETARIRWDLLTLDYISADEITLDTGGVASARALDDSKITLTGAGIFVVGSNIRAPWSVSGGGTWTTFEPDGVTVTGRGSYRVVSLVHWEVAPGEGNPAINDFIGRVEDFRAGLAVFRISYSDHSEGHLAVSCRLGFVPSPPTIHEGISISKGFVNYTNSEAPVAGVDANRNLFQVL